MSRLTPYEKSVLLDLKLRFKLGQEIDARIVFPERTNAGSAGRRALKRLLEKGYLIASPSAPEWAVGAYELNPNPPRTDQSMAFYGGYSVEYIEANLDSPDDPYGLGDVPDAVVSYLAPNFKLHGAEITRRHRLGISVP